jgi:hypothetical protein
MESKAKQAERCIFCGAAGTTKEHVLPQWLRGVLPEGRTTTPYLRMTDQGYRNAWTDRAINHQVKAVCRKCNGGWMSQLEQATKPLVARMAAGKQVELGPEDQKTVAAWATKVSIMYQYRRIPPEPERPERLKWLLERHEPPPHTFVWLARCGDHVLSWHNSGIWSVTRDSTGTRASGFISTTCVGELVFQVWAHNEIPELEVKSKEPLDIRIWPPSGVTLLWPPERRLFPRTLVRFASRASETEMRLVDPMEIPADRTFRSRQIRLAEVVKDTQILENVTFEDCYLLGPAVVVLGSHPDGRKNEFHDPWWDEAEGRAVWPLPPELERAPAGFLVLVGCRFIRCHFERISLAAKPAELRQIRENVDPYD